ncbi:unnamed protein product, partial [Staurois parvus]
MVGMDMTQPGTRSRPPRHPAAVMAAANGVLGRQQWDKTVQNSRQRITGHGPGSATEGQIKGKHREWSSHKQSQIPEESREYTQSYSKTK